MRLYYFLFKKYFSFSSINKIQIFLYWLLDMRVPKKIEFTNNSIKVEYTLALFGISFHCKMFLSNNATPFYNPCRSILTAILFGQKWHISRSYIHIKNKNFLPSIFAAKLSRFNNALLQRKSRVFMSRRNNCT